MKANETIYAGEVQFAGFSDSHTSGPIIKIRLPSSDDLDKFRALTVAKGGQSGHRFMLACVEIGDDEKPVPPPEPTKLADPQPKHKVGPYCMEAIELCRNEWFKRWVGIEYGGVPMTEQHTKQIIYDLCAITSRKELDTNPEAQLAFVNLIRLPFMQWMREHQRGGEDPATWDEIGGKP